jgi:hypothetical protein
MGKHALIFGASGISGNSLCNELLVYPNKDTFSRIIGLTNRPLTIQQAQLPKDARLELVSGIDLSDSIDDVKHDLRQKIKDVHGITHVFFMGRALNKSADNSVFFTAGLRFVKGS